MRLLFPPVCLLCRGPTVILTFGAPVGVKSRPKREKSGRKSAKSVNYYMLLYYISKRAGNKRLGPG